MALPPNAGGGHAAAAARELEQSRRVALPPNAGRHAAAAAQGPGSYSKAASVANASGAGKKVKANDCVGMVVTTPPTQAL